MSLSLSVATAAFQAPLVARPAVQRAAAVNMAIEDMPGKYAINGAIFDPLGLSERFDVKWLREAELKHGRLCMVAFLGYVSVDLGFKLPGHDWTSFEAHDKSVGPLGGAMGQLLLFVSLIEILAGVPAANYTMNGGDREPGDFGLDPLGYLTDATPEQKMDLQIKELKNGRLAMLAFSGVVTQAAIGHPNFPYV